MKVAMILRPNADSVYGGDTAVMHNLAAALRPLGAEVVVAKLTDIGPAAGFDLLHLMGMAPIGHVRGMVSWAQSANVPIVSSPLYWCDFRDWFERAVVSAPRWRRMANLFGKRLTWRLYRAFQTARAPHDPAWQVNRAGMMASSVVATTSHWENTWLANHFRLPEAVRREMQIAPYGIDETKYGRTFTAGELAGFRERHGLPAGYVAQVGRIEEKKNQLGLIRALFREDIPLVFVGSRSPNFAPDYADRCTALGRERGNTCFLGWLPEEELPLLYAAAAAHALPSWNELPGLVSLEAGACGTRIVSTRVSPLPEILGELASYCDPYDDASIRQAVLTALAAPVPAGLRERLLTAFTWREAARITFRLYEHVVTAHEVQANVVRAQVPVGATK